MKIAFARLLEHIDIHRLYLYHSIFKRENLHDPGRNCWATKEYI